MTGTYFWFVLSMLSGTIKKKRLRPVRSFAVTPPVQSNNFKIQNPPVVGCQQVLCMTPSPCQSPKENKFKLWPKIYVLQCTLYTRMNAHFGSEKNLSLMFQNYSELYLAVPPPTPAHCRLPPRERCSWGFWSVVVSPAGRSQILKSSIPEDSHPNGGGNPVKVTLRLSS
jgi:hypothetical protein